MRILTGWIAVLLPVLTFAQADPMAEKTDYRISVDLNNVQDDNLFVAMQVPTVKSEQIEFHMPKIVPGTYSISDFGRFVTEFTAMDQNGKELPVKRLDDNRWEIQKANMLDKVTYWVEDSYDTDKGNVLFEPGGTNIEEGKNFILNTFGFFGYLKGMKEHKFELTIQKPEGFYGATALPLKSTDAKKDVFVTDNYFDLSDSPLMYCVPDTATSIIGGAEILVSVYSPNGKVKADFVMSQVEPTLLSTKDYLGGKLPIEKYAFIIYLMEKPALSGAMGALEHSYSSLYSMMEIEPEYIAQTVIDIAAHEFLHIVTPLNIHSAEIGDFDFIDPKMSKHLWMYEGVTEYSAHHVQVKNDMIGVEDFLNTMRSKVLAATQYKDDLPFTEMSLNCLDEHEDQYGNVYQKGALIGMCIDIKLRSLSKGAYGIQDMMADLSKEYGKKTSFNDAELFDKIIGLTYPEMREFFDRYVAGSEPLPLQEYLGLAGVSFEKERTVKQMSLGGIGLGFDQSVQKLFVTDVTEINAFGKDMGYKKGDVLESVNGTELTINNMQSVIEGLIADTKVGTKIEMVVSRKNKKGVAKNKKLKGKAIEVDRVVANYMEPMETMTADQKVVFNSWLGQK